ncbi:hypothetical protein [Amycolatopsis dongchuanensis]|uniref:MFS transporter n=1 Tax=Amycolatopsis dongchuanensis TaxID=1070866 RepID=A0ABP8VRL7_9PSEU
MAGYRVSGYAVSGAITRFDRKKVLLSLMFGGLTVANVLGVPLGSVIGGYTGGKAADRALNRTLMTLQAGLAVLGVGSLRPRQARTGNAPAATAH